MKLHINKIHDTHSVRSQLLRIFLLAGMFPLLVIGIFSIASVRKQMLARYESLEKADGLRVASSLNDITTTIYSSSDTLLNSNQCLSLFAAESLDSGIEEQLTALERALQTYFENTAAVARIQIYTNNPTFKIPSIFIISRILSWTNGAKPWEITGVHGLPCSDTRQSSGSLTVN